MWCYHSLAEQSDKLHLFPSPTLILQLYSSIAHLGVGNKFLWKPRVTETWLNVLIYLQSDIKPGVKGMNGSICRCVVPWWWLACSPWTLSFCSAFIAFIGLWVCVRVCASHVHLHAQICLCLHHCNNVIIIKMYLLSSELPSCIEMMCFWPTNEERNEWREMCPAQLWPAIILPQHRVVYCSHRSTSTAIRNVMIQVLILPEPLERGHSCYSRVFLDEDPGRESLART